MVISTLLLVLKHQKQINKRGFWDYLCVKECVFKLTAICVNSGRISVSQQQQKSYFLLKC